jgi:hypothetical protein
MPRLPTEEERSIYVRNQKAFRAQIGDDVYIYRRAEHFENGWYANWTREMDNAIGRTGRIISDYNENKSFGIPIKVTGIFNIFWYPYTSLRIIR